jgi:transcriptional regulator with XRE-family HTH domain
MTTTRIAALRQDRGWTQERLAAESGVGLRTVQRMEAGHDASLETLSLIAEALHVPIRDMFAPAASNADEGAGAVDGESADAARGGLSERLGERLDSLEARAARQQEQRDRIFSAWRWLYIGVGVTITLLSMILGGIGTAIFFSYWFGGTIIAIALMQLVLEPRLDARFPLSRSHGERRRAAREARAAAKEAAASRPAAKPSTADVPAGVPADAP